MAENDLRTMEEIVAGTGRSPEATVPILHALQGQWGYVDAELIRLACSVTDISPGMMQSVASAYPAFRPVRAGRHIIRVCVGTACHVKGAERVHDAFAQALDLEEGRDTSGDGEFTLERVACLGCCMLAPAVQIDRRVYGYVEPSGVL